MENNNYDANSIKQLKGLEAVRQRPGMYIGSTDKKGLHHLIWEIVDNSVDEALAGYADTIKIRLLKDGGVNVEDNGRGAPSAWNDSEQMSALEMIFTKLHAGGKFDNDSYKTSGGLHGVGAAVTNALSTKMDVEVHRDGKVYTQSYEKGIRLGDVLEQEDNSKDIKTGTSVSFWPDGSIFKETTDFDYKMVQERLETKAYLNKGLRFILEDERVDKKEVFYYENGIRDFVEKLNKGQKVLFETPIFISNEDEVNEYINKNKGVDLELDKQVTFEIAIQYNQGYRENVKSFVNIVSTPLGGTHEIGFRNALTACINEYAVQKSLVKLKGFERFLNVDVTEGLTAVISIKHPDPQFDGQTKEKLASGEVRGVVYHAFKEHFGRFLEENPTVAENIVKQSEKALAAKNAAQKARDNERKVREVSSLALPGKLADCSSKNPDESEIFFVEGDSAGGSAKQGRNRFVQAILPLRGKVLNVEKTKNALKNQEIQTIISALGCSYGKDFNLEKLRYHKVVIMTDADVDGAHIRILLLTFFYRYLRELIENGNLYIAQPPLFKVIKGKKSWYVHSDEEKDEIISRFGENEKYNVQRFKGLGEMNAEQLWETTMDPETRLLNQITIEDAEKVEKMVVDLMGDDVLPRKQFIDENAIYADLDV